MNSKNGKNAFTLAEVLITLGIIGIVAAMTIPILMQKTQNAELKTAFKKSYANLTSAYNSITYENGGVPYDCYYDGHSSGDGCINLFNELKNKLKVIKTYTGAVDGINIPNYTASDAPDFNGTLFSDPTCYGAKTAAKSKKNAWVLADGSMLISYSGPDFSWAVFIIDTNGMKKPNKWGYDLFTLDFKNTATDGTYKMRIEDDKCGLYEKDGYRINDILMNN